jgi:uroporphyrin-III C-methyltransferase
VVLVTGHQKPGGESTDWVALGRSAQTCNLTLVIYMGAGAAQDIQSGLLQSMDASTPVALVQHATLSHQKTLVTTLSHMVQDMRSNGLGSPCIIAVGQVLESALAAAHDLAQSIDTEPPAKVASAS